MRYAFSVIYTSGKNLVTADCLSRKPLSTTGDGELEEEVKAYVCHILTQLPVTDEKLSQIWRAQQDDPVLEKVIEYSCSSWPDEIKAVDPSLRKYWNVRDSLTVQNGLLLNDWRIVIPPPLQKEILGRIHEGHLGITNCRARARSSCWWPGQSDEIAEMVRRCPVCIQERKERKEPLIPSEFPSRPWQKLGMDLFKLDGKWFILVVDYYSRFPEVAELTSMTTSAVVNVLKIFFSRHGVPEEMISDNGPQFSPLTTSPFRNFAQDYGFVHRTSSPHYPQSNGFVENGVKIMKNLLKKNTDWYKALLEYRASPLSNGLSPSELLMGRRIRSTLPVIPSNLNPSVDVSLVPEREEMRRWKQKLDFDKRHGVRGKADFTPGDVVWIKDLRNWGIISSLADTPRSYKVTTSRGDFRRNSSHLTPGASKDVMKPEPDLTPSNGEPEPDPAEVPPLPEPDNPVITTRSELGSPGPYRTRSGRVSKPPLRLIQGS